MPLGFASVKTPPCTPDFSITLGGNHKLNEKEHYLQLAFVGESGLSVNILDLFAEQECLLEEKYVPFLAPLAHVPRVPHAERVLQ